MFALSSNSLMPSYSLIRLNYLCMFYNWLAVVVRKQIPQKCRTNPVTSSTSLSEGEDSTTPAFLPPTSQSKHKDSTTPASLSPKSQSKDEDSSTPSSLPPTTQSKDEGSTTTKSDICQPPADESTDSAATGIYDMLHNLQFPASGLTGKFKHQALDLSNSCSQKSIC